jgi:hypothetical protein
VPAPLGEWGRKLRETLMDHSKRSKEALKGITHPNLNHIDTKQKNNQSQNQKESPNDKGKSMKKENSNATQTPLAKWRLKNPLGIADIDEATDRLKQLHSEEALEQLFVEATEEAINSNITTKSEMKGEKGKNNSMQVIAKVLGVSTVSLRKFGARIHDCAMIALEESNERQQSVSNEKRIQEEPKAKRKERTEDEVKTDHSKPKRLKIKKSNTLHQAQEPMKANKERREEAMEQREEKAEEPTKKNDNEKKPNSSFKLKIKKFGPQS